MCANWYQGAGGERPSSPVELPTSLLERHAEPSGYIADEGLVDAVNVALHLGQPLLLTGQPGTGKTQLAYSVAWELGYDPLLKFETKSTSVARDLFYTYDALGRFHSAQTSDEQRPTLDYIRFNALGLAILRANEPDSVRQLLDDSRRHETRRRSVVLVDEIDKAPRDFPNDLLNEIEGMYFRIPELGNETVAADADMRPVVILTSNSEKNLAEAFLRRCVFYNIPFPSDDRLREIVFSRLGESITSDRALLADVLEVFQRLREPGVGLLKRPSTGELLAWLRVLTARAAGDSPVLRREAIIEPSLACLIKTIDDRPKALEVLREWQASKQP